MGLDWLQELFFDIDYEKNILMQSDYLMYWIVFAYIIFVKCVGPLIMKGRKEFNLYYFCILFNILLVMSNVYIFVNIGDLARKYWHIRCNMKHNPEIKSIPSAFGYIPWQALLLKILELTDTVIFILRKKFNQASFLHVFHHSIVVILYWGILKRGEVVYYVALMGSLNCGVHVLTYLYYGLSAIGPGMRKYLWWKKYLTRIQILQFIVVLIFMAYSFLTGCEEFAFFEKMWFSVIVAFFALFLNFYFKAYSQAK